MTLARASSVIWILVAGAVLFERVFEGCLKIDAGRVRQTEEDEERVAEFARELRLCLVVLDPLRPVPLVHRTRDLPDLLSQPRQIRQRRPVFSSPVPLRPRVDLTLQCIERSAL